MFTVIYKYQGIVKHETFKTEAEAQKFLEGCKEENIQATIKVK